MVVFNDACFEFHVVICASVTNSWVLSVVYHCSRMSSRMHIIISSSSYTPSNLVLSSLDINPLAVVDANVDPTSFRNPKMQFGLSVTNLLLVSWLIIDGACVVGWVYLLALLLYYLI